MTAWVASNCQNIFKTKDSFSMFDYWQVLTGADGNTLLLVKEKLFMTGILKPISKYLPVPAEEYNMDHPLS